MKQEFLVAYDYGMGGLWAVISARSQEEIIRKYPPLKIVDGRPGWMDDNNFQKIRSTSWFDIDDPPNGWILAMLRENGFTGK